jgi:Cu/Ag efflux protein CusF
MVAAGLFGLVALMAWRAAVADETTTKNGPHAIQKQRTRGMVGTIEAIDKDNRTVTLADDQGEKKTVTVPANVKGFDKAAVGDRVSIGYSESVVLSLGKPGEAAPNMQTRESSETNPPTAGGTRSGSATRQVQATAEIIEVDAKKNQVTFKGPQGKVRTVTVEDPSVRAKLDTLKPGDTVELTYTEAMVGTITPAPKKK